VIERAAAADGDVALFSHGHMLRSLGACWVGLAPVQGQLLALGTAALCRLGYEHNYRVIDVWNQDSHLVMEQSA
jgi:broad specificity phosphatase PhoE